MSGSRPGRRDRPEAPEEALDSLASNPELEAALREAAEAVEKREQRDLPPSGADAHTEQVEELSAQLVEERDRYIRLQADFDNFRKRALKERQEAVQYGHQNVVKDVLSAVDNLERAIDHARKSAGAGKDLESLLQGVELVHRELLISLQSHGIVPVEALGKPFDPTLHEAISQAVDATVPANTIIDVFQKGYLLRDRLLRPARVVVAKEPDGS